MPPTDTQFENLKKRVKALEDAPPLSPAGPLAVSSWIQRHQVLTWLVSVTIPTVALVVAIYAGAIPHVEKDEAAEIRNQVGDGLKQPLQKIETMSDDISEIKGTLKAWAPFVSPQFFKRTAALSDRQLGESLSQLKAAARIGSESKAEVPLADLSAVGKRTVALASGNSDTAALAWQTTVALLQYRSVLNGIASTLNLATAHEPFSTRYNLSVPNGKIAPQVQASLATLPRESSAAADYIGQDQNKGQPVGPAMLFLRGGDITLDNMRLKNVALINVNIHYSGGPLSLENVYFLDCAFELAAEAHARQLAEDIFSYPSISLSVS